MLLVRVRLASSSIDGLGVFTVEPIARGTVVWRFTPGFDLDLYPQLLEAQPPLLREVLLHYGWIELGAGRYNVDVAARDIAAGEDLTLDYALLEGSRPGAP